MEKRVPDIAPELRYCNDCAWPEACARVRDCKRRADGEIRSGADVPAGSAPSAHEPGSGLRDPSEQHSSLIPPPVSAALGAHWADRFKRQNTKPDASGVQTVGDLATPPVAPPAAPARSAECRAGARSSQSGSESAASPEPDPSRSGDQTKKGADDAQSA